MSRHFATCHDMSQRHDILYPLSSCRDIRQVTLRWFIPFLVQKFGSVRGFDTDNNEKNHKVAVKGHIRYCNRQQSKFASQVAKNEHIRLTLEIALDAIERYIPESVRHLGKKLNVRSNTEHRYVRYMEDEQSDSDDSDDDSNVGTDYNIVNSVLLSTENDYGTGE